MREKRSEWCARRDGILQSIRTMTPTKTALITGGSRGLGAALASFLAVDGYRLILTARETDQLNETAASLEHHTVEIRALAGDVADPEHRRRLGEEVARFGRLDLLINNASVLGATPLPELGAYPLERMAETFAVNSIAPLGLVQETLPLLVRSSGLVINVTSDAARGGYPNWGGYGASKAALDLMSITLANELDESGVTVVSVDPGDLRTEMHQAAFPGEDISDRPSPTVTLPFWTWLLGQPRDAIHGKRFQAQSEVWEGAA